MTGDTRRAGGFSAWLPFIVLAAIFLVLVASPRVWRWGLALLFGGRQDVLYPRSAPGFLAGEHLLLVGLSSALAVILGVGTGIAVSRPGGKEFFHVAERLAAIGQTFPPAAVLALSVPILGFGFYPTVAALFLYGVLPILRNTLSGLSSVRQETIEAARGMGMTPAQVLSRVELPLAMPVVLAGVRTSVIINIGTATIGATIGAGGLGAPIISGLVNQNPAYLTEGALMAGLLALTVDAAFAAIERSLSRGRQPKPVP